MPISPDDPRLQQCGFAKIVDADNNIVFFMRKYQIILGRRSKNNDTDLVLGDNMNISRQHAMIRYSFENRAFELVVLGKNGVTIKGNLITPCSPPYPLQSQDVIQVASMFNLTFLLPKDSSSGQVPRQPTVSSSPALASQHQEHQPQQQTWNGHAAPAGHPAAAAAGNRQQDLSSARVDQGGHLARQQQAAAVQQQQQQHVAAAYGQHVSQQQQEHLRSQIAAQQAMAQQAALAQQARAQQAALAQQQQAAAGMQGGE